MRILIILTLTVAAFAYGWMHQVINGSPNYSSTKHRPAISTEATELPDGHMLPSAKLNFVCDRRSDSLELVKFFNATGGANWTRKWNLKESIDNWTGVTTDNQGCVVKLILLDNNLVGTIPDFMELKNLLVLSLEGNNLAGTIPDLKLPSLVYLSLSSNKFTGPLIDYQFMPNLQGIGFNNNLINGEIPNFTFLPFLEILYLNNNNLSGKIPNFSNLSHLKSLFLNNNNLVESIPNFDKLPELVQLWLYYNKLSNNIPNFDKIPLLTELLIFNNNLSGDIPDLNKLQNLRQLYLFSNSLTGNVPNFKLENLTEFLCGNNNISGLIPNFLSSKLTRLDLKNNKLNGFIDQFNNFTNLNSISLENNQLEGRLPDFNNMPSLQSFSCDNNKLSGPIPEFRSSSNLSLISLYNNKFDGIIPDWSHLKKISFIWLDNNNLKGIIPDFYINSPLISYLRIKGNKFTFKDFIHNIIQNKNQTDNINKYCNECTFDTLIYAPQQKIYSDTTILVTPNTSYTLDLLIDDTVTTSTYTWYKNGTLYKTIKGSNKLPFTPFASADAGTYTVKITNPLAPQLTLESWPIRLNAGPSLVCDRRSDSLELVKFYNATGGANWWKKWDLKKPINTWFGVKQSQDGCITGIYLGDTSSLDLQISGNNLSGTMIDLNLPHLLELNLASNKLEGNIPNFNGFPSLTSIILFNNKFNGLIPDFDNFPLLLDLNLGENRLSGNIPSLNKLTKLRNISLFSNILSGPLPAFGKALSLESIQIQSNKLDGSLPSLKNPILRLIYLHHNNFSGPIPSFDFTPNLETLNITDNYLTGTLPDFQRLPLLKVLALHNNLLSGSLPGLKSCLLLENYEVSVNQLDGLIPDLSHLKNLGTLTLSDNNFSGPLPKLDKFPGLKEVWLANNNFTGSLEDYTISNPLLRRGTFEGNKLTFSNIIKYHDKIKTLIEVTNKWSQSLFSYAPQQKIYVDTAITIPAYSNYPLDLKIDDTVTTSIYTWFKNDTVYKIITGKNKLLFSPFKPEDAGIYTVKITNPKAPQLILESRKINLMVGPQNGCNRFADSLELRRFFDSTGGNMWQNKTNWNSAAPINTWNGIKLNAEGCVLDIRLDQNKLSGTLIDLNLQGLSTLYLPQNSISGKLPPFKYLKNLTDLTLNHNMFTGSFPNIDSLKDLVVLGVLDNKLSGPLPILNNNKKIKDLNWGHNNFKGLFPDNSVLHPSLISNTIDDNKLTFEHLIQNLLKVQRHIENNGGFNRFVYAPQQKIYVDTTISIPSCTDYTLDLKIDDTVTSSTYSWFKDGVPFISIKGSNKLPFIGFNSTNTGTYTVKITNPLAPQLTLESPPIRLISSGTAPQINNPRDTALSCGSSYILPTLKGINLTGNGLYFSGPGKSGMSYKPGDKIISTTTLYAFDGSGSCFDEDTFTISFSIKPAFILKPDQYKVPYNQSILFDVLANDIIPPGLNVMVVIDNPVHGKSFYSQTSGKGTYTPDLGFIGKEILKYKVCPVSCPNVCDSSTVEFDVLPPCSDRNSLVLPNVIFPEGPSNDNRYFIVQALIDCPDDYGQKPTKLTVFNRWGDLVYRNTEYKNDWDGTNTQGLPLPSGTYYYLLDLGSVSAPIKGYVVIMR